MNDSYEGKNGKVKVMYVRSEDNAENKPKKPSAVLKMVVVITVTTKIVIIDVVITNFLVAMTAVQQVSLQGVAHHVMNQNLLAIAKAEVFLHGKRFLALLVKRQLKSTMALLVRAKSIQNSYVASV